MNGIRISSLWGKITLILVICLFGLPAQAALYSGGGTVGDPYIIDTAAEMNDIGNNPNDFGSYFLLTADIYLGGYTETTFNIIGPNSTMPFTGIFDGNGHTVSNFTYNSSGTDHIGLFGYVDDPNARIKNLGLIATNVDAGTGGCVGSLVGWLNFGSITDCNSVGGHVSGDFFVGGLIGYNAYGTVNNSCATGIVSGNSDVGEFLGFGGLVGYSDGGTVSNSYSTASVSGNRAVGGLMGFNETECTVSNSYATGSVSGNYDVGGLVGDNPGTVSDSYATASVSGDECVGGLVGINSNTVSSSYATGTVSGTGNYVGGLVGYNASGTVSNCYSAGGVNGFIYVGGLMGMNYSKVSNSYAAASVSGYQYIGGLVGYEIGSNNHTGNFWDYTVNPDANGIGNTTDPNVIAETTANMQTESTFTDAGWDFVAEVINGPNDIWRMCVDNVNYPLLSWQFNQADFICPDGVDLFDFSVLGLAWGSEKGDGNWNRACDISDPNDDMINMKDLDAFTKNWLAGVQ